MVPAASGTVRAHSETERTEREKDHEFDVSKGSDQLGDGGLFDFVAIADRTIFAQNDRPAPSPAPPLMTRT